MKRLAVVALVACSSPAPSPGLEGPTIANLACAPRDMNPYGVCYPHVGDGIVANFCSGSFCFAELYDPEGRLPARLLHLTAVSTWCGPALDEADFITGANLTGVNPAGVSWAKDLAPKVMFVQFLVDGPTFGASATLNDLEAFVQAHGTVSPTFLDAGLGVFFDAAAIPLNIDVDLRTMHILDTTLGFDTNGEQTLQSLLASMN